MGSSKRAGHLQLPCVRAGKFESAAKLMQLVQHTESDAWLSLSRWRRTSACCRSRASSPASPAPSGRARCRRAQKAHRLHHPALSPHALHVPGGGPASECCLFALKTALSREALLVSFPRH